MAALATLVVVAFTTWRLIANLKALLRALSRSSQQLLPALAELQTQATAAAESSAQLQTRNPAGPAAAGSRGGPGSPGGPTPGTPDSR